MEKKTWQNVKEVVYGALETPLAERCAYLDAACSGDPEFRREVDALLNSYDISFLEESVWPDTIGEDMLSNDFFGPGAKFGQYEIVRLIGRGGMGEVYLANDARLEREVAIKVVSRDTHRSETAERRLIREARAAAKLSHPNICSVYEVGETDGRPYIAMQYVDGETLDARIRRGPIPFDEAVAIIRKVADALREAHTRGIVHRDIKPANVIIDPRGDLKVLDFGLAKHSLVAEGTNESQLSEIGVIVGTAAFMSPEQARGQDIDVRSDIWSLGVVFYQMITGRMPFLGPTNTDTVVAILNQDLVPPSQYHDKISGSVNYVIDRTLQKDRDKRYSSIDEFDSDLVASASGLLKFSMPTGAINQTKKKFRTAQIGLVAIALLVLAGSATFWAIGSKGSELRPFSSANAGSLPPTKVYTAKRRPAGLLEDVVISPDGQYLAFNLSDDAEHSSIYVKRVNGGEPIAITDGSFADHSPVWSADGQNLAFVSDREGHAGIWSVSSQDPGDLPKLLSKLDCDSGHFFLLKWSSDRRIFARFLDKAKTVYLDDGRVENIEFRGIQGRVLSHFGISFDDQKISFFTLNGSTKNLWTQSIDSGNAELVGNADSMNGPAAWFPDNARLTYSSVQNGIAQVVVRDISGGEPRQLSFGDHSVENPAVFPDGKKIAYYSNLTEANIHLVDLVSKRETMLTSSVDPQIFPVFSPDGNTVAFQTTSDLSGVFKSPLKTLSLQDPTKVVPLEKDGFDPKWSPSGRELAYLRRDDENPTRNTLWKIDLNSKQEIRLSNLRVNSVGHGSSPYGVMDRQFDWSPDGSAIAFASGALGSINVWTVGSDGHGEHQLTSLEGAGASSPLWSPDGNLIAFMESKGTSLILESKENRVALLENGKVRYLSEVAERMNILGWTADGRGILYLVKLQDQLDLRIAHLDGSVSISVGRLPLTELYTGVAQSPDRNLIAFPASVNQIDNVYTVSTVGGSQTMVTRNEDPTIFYSGISWAPDGKTLVYSKQTGSSQISIISDPK